MSCVFTRQKPNELLVYYFFECKMSQKFAADEALQLLQIIVLESSDGEYSDSKSDELNNVIMDNQNKENSSDSNEEYINQEAPINTTEGACSKQ